MTSESGIERVPCAPGAAREVQSKSSARRDSTAKCADSAGGSPAADHEECQVTLLENIRSPRDLKDLRPEELPQLAAEIRDVLIQTVTADRRPPGPESRASSS